jgi:hypothetical protein
MGSRQDVPGSLSCASARPFERPSRDSDPVEVKRLMADPGIVRTRAKIEATIKGAQIYWEMQDRGEDFSEFCWSFTGG